MRLVFWYRCSIFLLMKSALARLYESLICNDAPRPADLIFVMAGRMERKIYGLELYRAGMSPKLVLSIGRFEVSKMRSLNVEGWDELRLLHQRTPPNERHFFLKLDASGFQAAKAMLPQWNTYGEVLAFRDLIQKEKPRRVMVVSTDVHLRRVALTMGRVCRGMPIEFFYCPVPPRLTPFSKDDWWFRPFARRFVLNEMIKLAGYRIILSLPSSIARRCMQLKDDSRKQTW